MPMGCSDFAFFVMVSSDGRSACGENGRRKPTNGTMPLGWPHTHSGCRCAVFRMCFYDKHIHGWSRYLKAPFVYKRNGVK